MTQAHLDRIAAVDDQVHAFLHVDSARALATAARVDAKIAAGEQVGPLAGVPLALKDVLTYSGAPTTCGSKILANWIPPYDATVTRRLLDADIVILGKTNMDEFAMGSSTENSAYGPTHNPWDLTRIPGGSGGGSSAALAAFEAPLAIGTDTGGSIRQPAVGDRNGRRQAHLRRHIAVRAGRHGLQPRPGRAVRPHGAGRRAAASGDRRPRPVRLDLDRCSGARCRRGRAVWRRQRAADRRGERTQRRGYAPGVEQRFGEAVELLAGLGAEIVEVSCPHFEYALAAYYLIMPSEVSSNLAKFDAMRFGLRVATTASAVPNR